MARAEAKAGPGTGGGTRPERGRGPIGKALSGCALALLLAVPGARAQDPTEADRPADAVAEAGAVDLAPASSLVREGRHEEAEEVLAGLRDAHPDDPALLLLHGEVLLAIDRAREAVLALRHGIEIAPEAARMHFQLGTALSRTGEVDQALEAFAREVELNEDPEVRYLARMNRSILLSDRGDWAGAAGELEEAVALKPGESDLYGTLATFHLNAGRPARAAETLERGETAGFRSARLHFNVGARFYNDRRYDEAERAFRRAIEIAPEMADAERSLGWVMARLGRDGEAVPHFRRYLELRPEADDAEEIRRQIEASNEP